MSPYQQDQEIKAEAEQLARVLLGIYGAVDIHVITSHMKQLVDRLLPEPERFFQDHGLWHDRVTGQHMYTQDQYDQLRREAFHNGYASRNEEIELAKHKGECSDAGCQGCIEDARNGEGVALLQQAIEICDAEGREWDSDNLITEKNYAHACRDRIRALLAAPAAPAPKGDVVVTRNEAGAIVAVTRQDREGRILSVIAEAAPAPAAQADGLPARSSHASEHQGLFRKFDVRRTDGSDAPGGKHHGCRYFVLDVTHDPYAKAALTAYAASCEFTHPYLARDLREKWGARQQSATPAEPIAYLRWDEMCGKHVTCTSEHEDAQAVYLNPADAASEADKNGGNDAQ